ncbi:hypothetical protein [Streptomyces sp. NPDC001508]|uniref:hypothetical protein n=1 Tax=Streptomyces sp. NPDC001508 TaxID=3154656 RepID=UPI0033280D8E
MSSGPEPGSVRRVVSSLDDRIEAATGLDIDTLWDLRDRGVLDKGHARLVDVHRELTQAETTVIFQRTLLHRLSRGEFPVDSALIQRIDRTVDQLQDAVSARDTVAHRVLDVLEPIEAATRQAQPDGRQPISAADQAALLAIARGAKVHEHLLTGRMSVATASGTRIRYAHLQRLEAAGLVSRDTDHPKHTGQPVTLTDAGRRALAARRSAVPAPPSPRPGTWPGNTRAPR